MECKASSIGEASEASLILSLLFLMIMTTTASTLTIMMTKKKTKLCKSCPNEPVKIPLLVAWLAHIIWRLGQKMDKERLLLSCRQHKINVHNTDLRAGPRRPCPAMAVVFSLRTRTRCLVMTEAPTRSCRFLQQWTRITTEKQTGSCRFLPQRTRITTKKQTRFRRRDFVDT